METLKEQLTEQVGNMSTSELVELNNAYSRENNIDGEIFENDDDFLESNFTSVSEAVRAATYGDYTYGHDYVRFNGYANLESFSYLEPNDLCELVSVILDYAIDNPNEFTMLDFDVELEETED